jgi:hypothetical protein
MTVSRKDIDALVNLMNTANSRLLDAGLALNRLQEQVDAINQNWVDPVPPKTETVANYARLIYAPPNKDGRYATQVLQNGSTTGTLMKNLRAVGAKTLLRYTSPVTRNVMDSGDRQAYGVWDNAWYLLSQSRGTRGNPIASTKFGTPDNPNYLINVYDYGYQQESAQFLVDKCRKEGWDGIYLDEINEFADYAGYKLPTDYGNETFKSAQLSYVKYVAAVLKTAGFKCYINLGSNYNGWAKDITIACDGQHIEYWIAQSSLGRVASSENGEWPRQFEWLLWNEENDRESICQADARTRPDVVFALGTFLLGTSGHAKFAAMNANQYGVGGSWWVPEMDDAIKLGAPASVWFAEDGVFTRRFDHGVVKVNASDHLTLGGILPQTAKIQLTS